LFSGQPRGFDLHGCLGLDKFGEDVQLGAACDPATVAKESRSDNNHHGAIPQGKFNDPAQHF
jgi:hypothetical protein